MLNVQIVSVKNISGVAKETNKPYSMNFAHCIVADAVGEPIVGQIMLSDRTFKELPKPGNYVAKLAFSPDLRGRLEPQIVGLEPRK